MGIQSKALLLIAALMACLLKRIVLNYRVARTKRQIASHQPGYTGVINDMMILPRASYILLKNGGVLFRTSKHNLHSNPSARPLKNLHRSNRRAIELTLKKCKVSDSRAGRFPDAEAGPWLDEKQ